MENIKLYDSLPCFKHIAMNLEKNNCSSVAAFALAYVQYLERCGITEPSDIEKQIFKITLLSQFNPAMSDSIDLLDLNGVKYTLSTQNELTAYKQDLLKLCKKPKSFSALYKTIDSKLQVCRFCPMSQHYTMQYRDEELQLLNYILTDAKHYRHIITSLDDIDKLFQSYDELYNIFNHTTKPISFPGINLLVGAIYTNVDTFFNPFIQALEFSEITVPFEKKLRTFGIRKGIENLGETFSTDIFNYLITLSSACKQLTEEEALLLRDRLINREPYIPVMDADATPQPVFNSKNNNKAQKDSTVNDKAGKPLKKGRKHLDTYHAESALSHSMDSEMGLDTPLKEYKVEGSLETDENKDIPVPSEKEFESIQSEKLDPDTADILSSDGEVLVERTVSENSIFEFDEDEDIDFDLDDEDEYEPVSDQTIYGDEDAYAEDPESALPTQLSSPEQAKESDTSEVPAAEQSGDMKSENDSQTGGQLLQHQEYPALTDKTDNDGQDKGTDDVTAPTGISADVNTDLRLPYLISDTQELDEIDTITDKAVMDRIVSHALLDGFCIVDLLKDVNDNYWYFVAAHGNAYKTSAAQCYFSDLLSFHKVILLSCRPLALYSYMDGQGLTVKKGRILPVDFLLFSGKGNTGIKTVRKFPSFREYYEYICAGAADYMKKKGHESLLSAALLYNIYGVSLYRNKYLELANNSDKDVYAFTYDETGTIIPTSMETDKDVAGAKTGGSMLCFLYNYDETVDSDRTSCYKGLTEDVLLELAQKGCFNKFRMNLIHYCPTSFTLFADSYCMEYIYNITLVTLFKKSTERSLYPLNVSLKKSMFKKE